MWSTHSPSDGIFSKYGGGMSNLELNPRWRCYGLSNSNEFLGSSNSALPDTLIEYSNGEFRSIRGPHLISFSCKCRMVGISAGSHYCLAWDEKGSLFSWGSNSVGLGIEVSTLEHSDGQVKKV